jgi:hypothetical protein
LAFPLGFAREGMWTSGPVSIYFGLFQKSRGKPLQLDKLARHFEV